MADLLISRVAPGVAVVRSVDPFDTLEIYRIDRSAWQHTPGRSGIYLLYGIVGDGQLTVYIGMSTTNMRSRIRSHHVNPARNWFGVLFAVPVDNSLLCQAIEAELIGDVMEAEAVDVIANVSTEARHRGTDDAHVPPAVEKISEALQLLLGSDIFSTPEVVPTTSTDAPVARMAPLAREYRGQAAEPRARTVDDPPTATHRYVGAGLTAWGRFESAEPDTRFVVLLGSAWRRPVLNPDASTYAVQVRAADLQDQLVADGVLDEDGMTFARDHVFDNWSAATRMVSGKEYSGAYHWQRLTSESA